MAKQVGARKNGSFKAISNTPSVNKTPVGSSTPPIPYPVSEDLASSTGVAKSVQLNSDPAYILSQSSQPSCKGDAAGSAKGLKSGTVSGEVKPVKGSSTVNVTGKPLIRDGDPCTLNGGNCTGQYLGTKAPSATSPDNPYPSNVKPETPKEQGFWGKASPWVHGALGVASFVPGLSIVTGAADAAIYAAEGEMVEAALAGASMIPGGKVATSLGKLGKGAMTMAKGGRAAEDAAKAAKAMKEAEEAAKAAKLAKEAKEAEEAAAKLAKEGKQAKEAEDAARAAKEKDGAKVKGNKTGEKGKCGEWLAKQDMVKDGFDEVVEVQNNSGHGIDLIGRNSTTGEVKVWEVKTTDGPSAPSLSKAQAELGGEKFTTDRLKRASAGMGNYGKVPAAMENATKVKDWLFKAKKAGKPTTYEKREVFIDDIEKGCTKHPNRPSKSKPW